MEMVGIGQALHTAGSEVCGMIVVVVGCFDCGFAVERLLVVPFDRSAVALLPFSLFRALRWQRRGLLLEDRHFCCCCQPC